MKINPYLAFNGDCAAAIQFYADALGGKILMMMTYADAPPGQQGTPEAAKRIMHARMVVGDQVLMASDAPDGRYQAPQGSHVSLSVTDAAQAERIYAALSPGGTVVMPLQETFWATRFAMFSDRFGTPWMINCEKAG